ncbi:hypothetical protein SMGES_31770 [Serratia marcescens]|nr:hypothetical protein SMGES_31770 [Serratia marcescens]
MAVKGMELTGVLNVVRAQNLGAVIRAIPAIAAAPVLATARNSNR